MLPPYKYIRPVFFLFTLLLLSYSDNAQEICNNGKDDDKDSLIDLRDPDCQCRFNVTGNLLLNGSFESFSKCPVTYLYNQEKAIAEHWQYGTYTNVNEAYFYHNFQCAYDSEQIMLRMPPARPLPDGTGFISILKSAYIDPAIQEKDMAKSYVSQCLTTALKKGEDYTLSFYAGRFRSWDNRPGKMYPFDVAIYGNADCDAAPFGKVNALGNGCPANYPGWVLLGKTTINSSGQWVQSKMSFTAPSDIQVIEIGSDCSILTPIIDLVDSTTFLDYYQYYLDDLQLMPTKDFPFQYIHPQAGSYCNDHPVLVAPATQNATYQWYKDSIAIAGATNSIYHVLSTIGNSYYNVLMNTGATCIISEPFLITESKLNEIHITADTIICSENYSLLLAPAFDGITYSINGISNTDVTVNNEGIYIIIARDATGCQRSFSTNVRKLNCSLCEAHIPTAFTPNGDGNNDLFRPKFNCDVSGISFMIFNQWGQKIFGSNDINKGWDGTYLGTKLQTGTYVYIIQYKTVNNIPKTDKGTVVLIR